jgi:hypothetical protein
MTEARDAAELRRLARAGWSVRVFQENEAEAEADADAEFWLQLSPVDRVVLAWSLSRDLFGDPDEAECRLSRSAASVRRL